MMDLDELKKNSELIDAIDWEMTPEEAVRLYLEWGNNWSRGYHMIRSKNDVSHYFVLNTWEEDPIVYFVRRNSEGSVELARIEVPPGLKEKIREDTSSHKGIYAVEDEVKEWLKEELETG